MFAAVLDLDAESDLPVVRDPIGGDLGTEVELAAAFLARHRDRTLHAHDPEIPRIGDRAGLAWLRRLLDLDGQPAADAVSREIVQKADGDCRRESLPLRIFGVAAL